MATNNNFTVAVKTILDSVKTEYHTVLGDQTISKNTRHTKTYNLRKEIKRLIVIETLLKTMSQEAINSLMSKDKNFAESLLSIINPEDGGTKIVVKEGDAFMDLVFNVYKDTRDVVARINKAADKAGLKLDSATNKFVRK